MNRSDDARLDDAREVLRAVWAARGDRARSTGSSSRTAAHEGLQEHEGRQLRRLGRAGQRPRAGVAGEAAPRGQAEHLGRAASATWSSARRVERPRPDRPCRTTRRRADRAAAAGRLPGRPGAGDRPVRRAVARPADPARGRGRRRQDRGRQGAGRGARPAADPAAVLRGHRHQPGAVRVGLRPPDAPDPGAVRASSSTTTTRSTSCSARSSCSSGRCWRPCGPATGPCCSSTRSTGPTTSSRRSCSSCSPTSRSPSPRSARSGPRRRRWWCSRPTAPASCTTRSSAAASTTGSATRAPSARSRSCWSARRASPRRWPARWSPRSTGCASSTWPSRPAWPRPSTGSRTLGVLGETELDARTVGDTLGAVVKERDDLELVREQPRGDRPPVPDGRADRRAAGRLRPTSCATRACAVGSGDVVTYCAAMAPLDPTDLRRPVLGRAHHAGHPARPDPRLRPGVPAVLPRRAPTRCPKPLRLDGPGRGAEASRVLRGARRPSPAPTGDEERRPSSGWSPRTSRCCGTSRSRPARPRSWPRCAGSWRRIRLTPPRAAHPAHGRPRAGRRPDLRRTVRETMRMHGEPSELFWRRRRHAAAAAGPDPRRVRLDGRLLAQPAAVRLLDHAGPTARVEVFCFGTRLTRITRALERRRPDDALDAGRPRPSSTGRAAPGSATRSTRSCATGDGAACAGAASW